MLQAYEGRVNDEFVLRGNTAILKCIVPSFVTDFVNVVAWLMDNETIVADENTNIDPGSRYTYKKNYLLSSQSYLAHNYIQLLYE